jgi:hypothetical protein
MVMKSEFYRFHQDAVRASLATWRQQGYKAVVPFYDVIRQIIQLYLFQEADEALEFARHSNCAVETITDAGDFAEKRVGLVELQYGFMPTQEESKAQQFVDCKAEAAPQERPVKFREWL